MRVKASAFSLVPAIAVACLSVISLPVTVVPSAITIVIRARAKFFIDT